MNRHFVLFILINCSLISQNLPNKDNGLAIHYNYSQRHIPNYITKSIQTISLEYKHARNFKNNLSLKYGVSIFFTGHVGLFSTSFLGETTEARSTYGFLRMPCLFSYNIKNIYMDIGAAPCLRIMHSNSQLGKSSDLPRPGITYTLEAHFGYFIPMKKRRLFIEAATYFSEIQQKVFIAHSYYNYSSKNDYTLNLLLGIGIMFNKSEN